MLTVLRRVWKYAKASLNSKFNEKADPKVQLEQAIIEAQDQHRRLTEQAATIIANHKQAEIKLNRAMEELERVTASARQAVIMADAANQKGETDKTIELTRAAETFANRIVAKEQEIDSLKSLILQSAEAASKARAAVSTNSVLLQGKLTERQKLLSQLDQAKMQEQMNAAMESLAESTGQDVPSLEEVRAKIETRYARALGISELKALHYDSGLMELGQTQLHLEAQAKLDQIRRQIGSETSGELPPGTPLESEDQAKSDPTDSQSSP